MRQKGIIPEIKVKKTKNSNNNSISKKCFLKLLYLAEQAFLTCSYKVWRVCGPLCGPLSQADDQIYVLQNHTDAATMIWPEVIIG